MPKSPRASGDKHITAFKRDGWKVNHIEGSHHILIKEGRSVHLSIPVHKGKTHIYLEVKMLTAEMIIKKIGEDDRGQIKKYGVKRIGLFGSYVRGEERVESDLDILVEFERGKKTFDNYMGLKFFLEDLSGCKVDLVISETIKPDLKPYILGNVRCVPRV